MLAAVPIYPIAPTTTVRRITLLFSQMLAAVPIYPIAPTTTVRRIQQQIIRSLQIPQVIRK